MLALGSSDIMASVIGIYAQWVKRLNLFERNTFSNGRSHFYLIKKLIKDKKIRLIYFFFTLGFGNFFFGSSMGFFECFETFSVTRLVLMFGKVKIFDTLFRIIVVASPTAQVVVIVVGGRLRGRLLWFTTFTF